MKKRLFGLSLLLLAGNLRAGAQSRPEVTEIAIYKVAASANPGFPELLNAFRRRLAQRHPYRDYATLRDVRHPGRYLDLLHWADATRAQVASHAVKTGAPYRPFTQALDSVLAYGDFDALSSFSTSSFSPLMSHRLYEVVLYRLTPAAAAAYGPLADATNAFLRRQPGFVSRQVLRDHRDPAVFADLVTWESRAAAEAAQQAAAQEPSVQPFFAATEQVLSFGHYELFK